MVVSINISVENCNNGNRQPSKHFILINKRIKENRIRSSHQTSHFLICTRIVAMRHKKQFCIIACENMITNCTGKVHIYFILCVMVVQMFRFAFVSVELFFTIILSPM